MAMRTEEGWVIVDWQEAAQKKYGNACRCRNTQRSWTINCPNICIYFCFGEIEMLTNTI